MSAAVSVLFVRYRASRLKMTSVGVLRRDRVKLNILASGAWGLNGKLRTRKTVIVMKRTFRLREVLEGRGRGDGRCANVARMVR